MSLEYVGKFRTQLGSLPSGDAGTRMTLAMMQAEAEGPNGANNRVVREAAINVVRQTGAPAHNPLAQLAAIFRWVRDNVYFVTDPVGTQVVQSPRYTLHVMAGNCVQRAMLLAAMARSVGIPARLKFRAIAAAASHLGFSHVYVVANVGGRDVPLDPTYEANPVGYEFPGARRRLDYSL